MKSNIYKIWLASSFSICCLIAPEIVTAQEIFLHKNNFVSEYQQNTETSVTSVTQNREISSTTNATKIGKTTHEPKHNVANTSSENPEIESSQSQARTGLGAKGGKKPPRKG